MKAPDLVALIGPEAARKIVEEYGGGWERVPPMRSYQIAVRDSLILRLAHEGMSTRSIALRLDCSTAVVIRVRRNARKLQEALGM